MQILGEMDSGSRTTVLVGCAAMDHGYRTLRVRRARAILARIGGLGARRLRGRAHLGPGVMLVDECLALARHAGHRRVTLWTDSGLDPARRLYQRVGLRKVAHVSHQFYGEGLVAETWELDL